MISPVVEKTIKQLRKSNLSLEDRTALTTILLDKLQALPLNDSIIVGQNSVIINGRPLEVDQLMLFRDSCVALRDNMAYKVLREQIKYLAIVGGVHKAVNLEQSMFHKAALWVIDQEEKLLEKML